MFKHRIAFPITALLLCAAAASASPLRVNDRDYRGAFTILGAGRIQGASARYWTDVRVINESDHPVYLRLELYSTDGYREALMSLNPVPPAFGGGGFTWGGPYTNGLDPVTGLPTGPQSPDHWTTLLGYNTMGALRIVAVHQDGTDDDTAVIHGSGRLMVAPNSGGYMWESQPGFTDYELGGVDRGKLTPQGALMPGFPGSVGFVTPYLKNVRMAVVVTNFDRQHDLHFEVPERCAQFLGPNGLEKKCVDGVVFDVPAGETRRVPVALLEADWVDRQALAVRVQETGNHNWTAFVTAVDNQTNDSIIVFDPLTEALATRH
jgi:hypothetical protein